MAKHYNLKKDVSITFTPKELWNLTVACEGARTFYKDLMRKYPEGSRGYKEYQESYETTVILQQKLIDARNANSEVEEI